MAGFGDGVDENTFISFLDRAVRDQGGPRGSVLRHLESETGRALNGLPVRYTGRDPGLEGRFHVRVKDRDGHERGLKVKFRNLASPGCIETPCSTLMPDADALAALRASLAHADRNTTGREDWDARRAYVRRHVDAGNVPPRRRCADSMLSAEELQLASPLVRWLPHIQTACRGDGWCDFRQFGEGLHAGVPGGPTELKSLRFKEWYITGICQRCQMEFLEGARGLVAIDRGDGAVQLVPR